MWNANTYLWSVFVQAQYLPNPFAYCTSRGDPHIPCPLQSIHSVILNTQYTYTKRVLGWKTFIPMMVLDVLRWDDDQAERMYLV